MTASGSSSAERLERTVYPSVPPKVEYRATRIPEELHQHLVGLTQWAERHRNDVAVARRAYDMAAKELAEGRRAETEVAAPNP